MKFFNLNSPIKKNILANFIGVGVQVLNQLLFVPLFLYYWKVDLYSDWIVISAVGSFFSMSDIGLNSVTANTFAIDYASGDRIKCQKLILNNFVLVFIFFLISIICTSIYIEFFNLAKILNLHSLDEYDSEVIFLLFIAKIFFWMLSVIPDSVYRAVSLNHRAVFITNLGKFIESLAILVCLFFDIGMIPMLLITLFIPISISIYKIIATNKIFEYSFKFKMDNLKILRKILFPSISFLGFPAGYAIVYQGFTVVINKFFGSNVLVQFNTIRALTSFIRQVLTTMQQAVWPEFSIAFGKNDILRMKRLHRKAFAISMYGAIFFSLILVLFGSQIYYHWTKGMLEYNFSLLLTFLLILLTEVIWTTSSVCLIATNKHTSVGLLYVFLSVICIIVAMILSQLVNEITLIVLTLLIIHIPMSLYTLREGIRITNDTFDNFYFSIFNLKKIVRL